MNPDNVRILIAAGFFMLLVFLRLEAEKFGAAEFDEPNRRKTGPWTRTSWYAIGLALLAAIYVVHPSSSHTLFLVLGRKLDVLAFGAILAVVGLGQAAAFARYNYGYLRLPAGPAYPGAALNSIATAVIDEAAFRGVLLGTMVALGVPGVLGVLLSTLAYVLATRLATRRRHPYTLALVIGMGLVFGVVTLITNGIGAAIVGHAVTSFAVFVCTGHAGQVQPIGAEPEEIESRNMLPEGWEDARRPSKPGRGAEPRDFAGVIEESGFSDRTGRHTADGRRPKTVWVRFAGRPSGRPKGKRRHDLG
ncbi:MAG TPA: CPBP family intramembrane glutamic endopeptidase [Candidatus Limnocylindrales bacterium]